MDMALVSLATTLAATKTMSKVSVAVHKLTQDTYKQTGNGIVDMMKEMEQSVAPNIGGNIDLKL